MPRPGAFCVIWGGQEYQGEAPCLAVIAVDLYQAEFIAVKIQCFVQVAGADHGVQVVHKWLPGG